jgi:tetratricopeptide (TPR) repeat protein
MTAKAAVSTLVIAALAVGCRAAPPSTEGPVGRALLALATDFGTDAAATVAARGVLDEIVRRVERRHRAGTGDVADTLDAVIFGELGFEREVDSSATRFFDPTAVLTQRRGSCLGLGALYLAVAERVGMPLDGILLPGHFFVRTRGPRQHNVELLRRGEAMPDDWYRQKYGPWPGPGSAYLRPVTTAELIAIHWYNRGNDLRAQGDAAGAELAFRRAAAGFPAFAEASASLGALLQARGALAEAGDAYRAAARAWPDLPGLAENVERLRRQLRAATP